jgi:hypothetical protein
MADPAPPTAAIDIINSALVRLGLKALSDIDQNEQRARIAKETYASIRDDVLRGHPWKFALRYAVAPISTLPTGVWEYDYAFTAPTQVDGLAVLAIHAVEGQSSLEGDEWTVSGEHILTNLTSDSDATILNVCCICRVLNVVLYDASFIEHLCERLQAEWAEPLRKATNLAELKVQTAGMKERRAMSSAAKEGTPRKLEASTFLSSR